MMVLTWRNGVLHPSEVTNQEAITRVVELHNLRPAQARLVNECEYLFPFLTMKSDPSH